MKNSNKLIIGCRTTENELLSAMDARAIHYDIAWIEARLHNMKTKLNTALQEIIDSAAGYDTILFATGFCGNSISGLNSRDATLIFPRVDDCTSFLLGGCQAKLACKNSYFLTEGWLKGDANIWNEYLHSLEKYGEETTRQIFQMMFAHYQWMTLLDTGCYELAPVLEKARSIADTFSLDCRIVPATTSYIQALLTGPWDEDRFLVVHPGETITDAHLSKTY